MTPLSVFLLGLVGSVAARPANDLAARAIVTGHTFDRYVQIFLENTDYNKAIANTDLSYLASQGISLTNYYALTHPSQPNYVAAAGGATFGVTDNSVYNLASTTKTIVDLLEPKGVSWSIYQEDMPSAGFTGDFKNAQGKSDYVRKHNPLISFKSISNSASRLAKTKNFVMFNQELAAGTLPQWMFITPNMTNNAHDSSISVAGSWSRRWLTPLLANPNFNIDRTLVILTFDEGSTSGTNRIYAVLLGSAVPTAKKGTTNSTFFNHYSLLKTAEANWDLGSLGQGDVKANAFF